MNDFVSFLFDQGVNKVEELSCFVHSFLGDPSIFYELDQSEREEIENKIDEALGVFKSVSG
jgi:hypothetical protein